MYIVIFMFSVPAWDVCFIREVFGGGEDLTEGLGPVRHTGEAPSTTRAKGARIFALLLSLL